MTAIETQFNEAITVVIKYLCEKHNPHTKIIVECDRYEIVQWIKMEIIEDYIKD